VVLVRVQLEEQLAPARDVSGTPSALVSSINHVAGQTRANNAVATLNGLGELAVFCGQASGTVHFILDVNGHFE
jgi:hypothetical protein